VIPLAAGAPHQVVIVPIPPRKGSVAEAVLPKAREVMASLRDAGVRVHLDDRDQYQPGYKYADWEMRGVPLRLEIGPKDIEKDQCVLVRRDNREKTFAPLTALREHVEMLLDALQADLRARARRFVAENTSRVATYNEFKEAMATKRGFILAGWCGDAEVEARIKEETKATIRVIPLGEEREAACIKTGQKGR